MANIGDLAAYSIKQEVALQVCEARRAALAELIRAHAEIVTPDKAWWKVWR